MRNFPRLWISRPPYDKALEGFSERYCQKLCIGDGRIPVEMFD